MVQRALEVAGGDVGPSYHVRNRRRMLVQRSADAGPEEVRRNAKARPCALVVRSWIGDEIWPMEPARSRY